MLLTTGPRPGRFTPTAAPTYGSRVALVVRSTVRHHLRVSESGRGTESGTADRLIAFSDAVVAIAITLLALELPVPTGQTTQQFWASVQDGGSDYLAFLISFVVISSAWSQHHHVFRWVERTDSMLRALHMFWLFTIVLNPFATKLLTTESGDADTVHALRWSFYALLQVLATATFLAMVRHMMSAGLAPDAPPDLADHAQRRSVGSLAGFALSIPVFFVTNFAWILWIAGPLVAGWTIRWVRRRSPRSELTAGPP